MQIAFTEQRSIFLKKVLEFAQQGKTASYDALAEALQTSKTWVMQLVRDIQKDERKFLYTQKIPAKTKPIMCVGIDPTKLITSHLSAWLLLQLHEKTKANFEKFGLTREAEEVKKKEFLSDVVARLLAKKDNGLEQCLELPSDDTDPAKVLGKEIQDRIEFLIRMNYIKRDKALSYIIMLNYPRFNSEKLYIDLLAEPMVNLLQGKASR